MGVHRLTSYINDCGLYHLVDMQKIADDFRSRNDGDPVIAVDGSHCVWYLHRNIDSLRGGQYKEFGDKCMDFVKLFHNMGFRLSFFFDGLPVEEKISTWLKRRKENAKEICSLFTEVRAARSKGDHYVGCRFLPEAMVPYASVVFKQIGCEVRLSTTDCDTELAQFAASYKCCVGVLSNDSDFLIYGGLPCVFSLSSLQIGHRVTAWRFRSAEIASQLGIQVEDLPTFASFVGNDIFRKEALWQSHRNLRTIYGPKPVIELVADLLKRSPRGNLKSMCEIAFGDRWREGLEMIEKSIHSYRYRKLSFRIPVFSRWDRVLQRVEAKHVSCEIPGYVLTVMKCRVMRCGDVLEDLSICHTDFPPTGLIGRRMRARMYTVLLWDSGCGPFQVTEHILVGLDEVLQETVVVEKRLPKGVHHPGLLELWSGPKGLRWNIFTRVISPTKDLSALRELSPEHLVVPTAALFYLYHEAKILTKNEVRTFMIVAVSVKRYSSRQLSSFEAEIPNERAIYLASLFVRTVLHVLDAAGACGLSFPRPADCHMDAYFDGKLFHHIYSKSRYTIDPSALMTWDESCEHTYRCLMNIIQCGVYWLYQKSHVS